MPARGKSRDQSRFAGTGLVDKGDTTTRHVKADA
jgi:hypothetical protein